MKWIIAISSVVLPIMAIGLFVSQIIFTNNLAQDGSTLKEVTSKVDALAYENERLEQEIASASSLLVIHEKAATGGFIEAKNFLTIAQGKYLVSLTQKR